MGSERSVVDAPAGTLVLGAGADRARRRAERRTRRREVGPTLLLLVGTVLVVTAAAWFGSGRLAPAPPAERATDVAPSVAATGAVLDAWWDRELDRLDMRWTPVGARLTDGDGTVLCDGEGLVVDSLLADNAFATTCAEGPAVAFDEARFPVDVVSTQVVLAHEWGHVVQVHNPDIDLPTIDPTSAPAERELQADCFAGAWAAEHVVGEFHGMMLASIGGFGDPSWVAVDHEQGHGTPDERRTAYELGVAGGVAACLPPGFDPR